MTDKVSLVIDVMPEEHEQIERLAHQYGYDTPGEYLLSLVEVVTQLAENDETKEDVLEGFREGWRAAMTGKTIPASELWDALRS